MDTLSVIIPSAKIVPEELQNLGKLPAVIYPVNDGTVFDYLYEQYDAPAIEKLIRDDIKLDVKIQNIDPGLTPAFEITNVNCKIKLSQRNKYQDKFFL